MEDAAAVAGLLWDEWLPASVRKLIGEPLPGGAEDARRLAVWLAGVHDIGKATPAFACQVEQLAQRMREQGLAMPSLKTMGEDRKAAPHGLAGQLLLDEWLQRTHAWKPRQTGQFTVVVGGHHGVPPEHGQIAELYNREELLRTPGAGRESWRSVQYELLNACAERFGVADRLGAWAGLRLPQTVQALLTAVVIVADWIASNPDLFGYFPEAAGRSPQERLAAAWRGLDLPKPWRAAEPGADADELIAARFRLPEGAEARPVQRAAVELAREMSVPGLMVIEALMGEGKTEAALAATEILAARSGAGGVYVALPTMATGNAMFAPAAAGVERGDDAALSELAALRFGVRVDQPGTRIRDFHTAHHAVTGRSMPLSERYYLADAVFVAALEGEHDLLARLRQAVLTPVSAPYLGRRSCPPAQPLDLGLHPDARLEDVLTSLPWQASSWYRRRHRATGERVLTILREAADADETRVADTLRDQPLSYDASRRRHALRTVVTTAVPLPAEEPDTHDPIAALEGENR